LLLTIVYKILVAAVNNRLTQYVEDLTRRIPQWIQK